MKRQTIVAIVIAALLVSSFVVFRYLNSNDRAVSSFSLAGDWKLDSIYAVPGASDSVVKQVAIEMADSSSRLAHVRVDSGGVLTLFTIKDSTPVHYRFQDSTLYVGADSVPLRLNIINNGLVAFSFPTDTLRVLQFRKN